MGRGCGSHQLRLDHLWLSTRGLSHNLDACAQLLPQWRWKPEWSDSFGRHHTRAITVSDYQTSVGKKLKEIILEAMYYIHLIITCIVLTQYSVFINQSIFNFKCYPCPQHTPRSSELMSTCCSLYSKNSSISPSAATVAPATLWRWSCCCSAAMKSSYGWWLRCCCARRSAKGSSSSRSSSRSLPS